MTGEAGEPMKAPDQFDELEQRITQQLQRAVADLRAEVLGRLDAGSATVTSGESPTHRARSLVGDLLAAAVDIAGAESQAAILRILLARSGRFSSRAALFLTEVKHVRGWGSRGFEDSAKRIEELKNSYDQTGPWSRVADGRGVLLLSASDCAHLCARLQCRVPAEGAIIPLVLRDRIAAALYVDRLATDTNLEIEALQLLTYMACQALETLPFRQLKVPVTLHLDERGSRRSSGAPLWDPTAVTVPVRVPGQPESAAEPPARTAAAIAPEEVHEATGALPPRSLSPPPAAPLGGPSGHGNGGGSHQELSARSQLRGNGHEPARSPSGDALADDQDELSFRNIDSPANGDSLVHPPDDFEGPGRAFHYGAIEGEADLRADETGQAERLARLLVSELKLYNRDTVEEGRKHGDLYARLAADIERSRQLYEERVDEQIRHDHDFFRNELLRILADGDTELLGI